MRLKTIKEKTGDTHYTKYVFKEMDLIKEKLYIPKNDLIFFIGYFYFGQVFLHNQKVYVANTKMEHTETREPIVDTMVLSELYEIRTDNYEINAIIKSENFNKDDFIQNIFIPWSEQPCDLNYEIDNTYSEVINYLNSYTKETFKTNRYLFYSKRDNDYNFINNIYAYDLKTQTEMKLYIPNKWEEINGEWLDVPPQDLADITVDDLGQNLSDYSKRECKKAFLKIANTENTYFKVKNYWVMELVKLFVQPVLILHEWSCHRCFCKPDLFGHIWVYDFPDKNEEPSFFITDNNFTKVAVLKFKSAEYLFKGIYKRNTKT
jgi:hypothetical protein